MTHRTFIIAIVAGIFLAGALGGAPCRTYAQGVAVKVQPSTINERLDPGAVNTGVLTVTNQNGGRQTYYIGTKNIENMDEDGRPIFSNADPSDPLEAASWIVLDNTQISLEVGESISIPYRISVPATASPGSYFAAIFVTREADKVSENGAGVGFEVASLVNLRVNGDANEEMSLREFSTPALLYQSANVPFNVRVENIGTVHERPQGIITLTDMLGHEAGKIPVNEKAAGVMPHTDRVFTANWSSDRLAFGKYTAVLTIVYGDSVRKSDNRSLTFWIVPWKQVGMVLGGVALILGLFALALRAYVRRALRKAGHGESARSAAVGATLAGRMFRTVVWLMFLIGAVFIVFIVFNA